jgi:F-type H+-transporting ATPase subunit b
MLKIPPDYTFVLQVLIFVVFWVAMKRLWIDPALRIIHERARRSEGAIREAESLQAEAEGMRTAHAAALDEAKAEAQREMQEIVRVAETEQQRLIGEARAEAQRTLSDVRTRVAEEMAAARQGLHAQAGEIAREVARKVLGRAV